jgi:hypothetical protein
VSVLELTLLFGGFRILLSEQRIPKGEVIPVESHDTAGQDVLVCSYFDGRAIRRSVFWYSANNVMGRDSCRFFIREI